MHWILAIFLSVALAKPSPEAQYWENTDFPIGLLRQFINNDLCHSSFEYLKSCREALKVAQDLGLAKSDFETATEFERSIEDLQKNSKVPIQMFRAKVTNAHLRHFDPYAEIRPTRLVDDELTEKNRDFVGVGLFVESSQEGIRVVELIPGSPAQQAGVEVGDILQAIDSVEIGLDIEKVADLISGPSGSKVALRFLRKNKMFPLVLKRARLSASEFTGQVVDQIAILRVRSFVGNSVCSQIRDFIKRMGAVKGLVLDLRDNPGGQRSMAVCTAGLFLGSKPVMASQRVNSVIPTLNKFMGFTGSAHEPLIWSSAFRPEPLYQGPMAVLIDNYSASGAEIVAGALRDYGRARLVGLRTYGKGSVQVDDFVPGFPSLVLKWSAETFYLPSLNSPQGAGIEPDFKVPQKAKETDSQLSHAFDLLKGQSLFKPYAGL